MKSQTVVFQSTVAKSGEWLAEMMALLGIQDGHKALRALRAGLHTIRDRLPPAEVVDLGAQLPLLLRGLYYEGWRLGGPHIRVRNRAQLLDIVREQLEGDTRLDPETVLRATIRVLEDHVTRGELDDVVHTAPRALADLWQSAP